MNESYLKQYGADDARLAQASESPDFLARVVRQNRTLYRVATEQGEINAHVSGKFSFDALDRAAYPIVGDWVLVDRETDEDGDGVIQTVLSRSTFFARRAAGSGQDIQPIAANMDKIFLCMAVNEDFNLRRMERYLTALYESGAEPVVILTKADLCDGMDALLEEARACAPFTDVAACSEADEASVAAIAARIQSGMTVGFVGSSGVGKSTLINRLLGEEHFVTRDIRADGKGRHTTTHRELIVLPSGGILIDTPGCGSFVWNPRNTSRLLLISKHWRKAADFGTARTRTNRAVL
jgi:ribosome biogenesis GTPase